MEMAAGLGAPSTAFYFVFPFGNQSCGGSEQALNLSNPSQLWCIFTCKRIPGPSEKKVLGTSEVVCTASVACWKCFGALGVGAWEQQTWFEA